MSSYLYGEDSLGVDDSSKYPAFVGFIAAAVAVIFFGSNWLPVKKYETGDGIFFQWVCCSAIWWCGLVLNIIRYCPTFYPFAMIGGAIWATGNILTVPIIKTIGLGQGILIWASFNLLTGWASGKFGWLGTTPQTVGHPTLNYIGVALCLSSSVVFFFVKSQSQTQVTEVLPPRHIHSDDDDVDPLLPQTIQDETVTVSVQDKTFLDKMSPLQKRIFGCVASIVAGSLYGLNFQPVFHVMNRYDNASPNVLDYVFAHFCGIYLASSVYFLIYCAYKVNRPLVYPRTILPGFISGIMWAVADIGWFIANGTLSEPVAFPIITAGPAIVGALWGVLLFGEIKGRRNLLLLFVATCVVITGAVITGLSLGTSSSDSGNSTTTEIMTTAGTTAVTTTHKFL